MQARPIDKDLPIPLYFQIQEQIKEQIRNGQLKPGDRLPTEQWYSEAYGVSRVTVRKTLSELLAEGVIERSRGKGPVVANSRFNRQTENLTGLHEELARSGLKATAHLLDVKRRKATALDIETMYVQPGETIIEFQRIRYADEKPISLQTVYLRERFCEGINITLLENGSLYQTLENQFGLPLAYAKQTVAAKLATKKEAEHLAIKEKSPLLLVKRTTFLTSEEAVEYSVNLYAADRYNLTMKLYR